MSNAPDRRLPRNSIVRALVRFGSISGTQAKEVKQLQQERPSMSTGDLILDLGICSKEEVERAEEAVSQQKGGEMALLRERFLEAGVRANATITSGIALATIAADLAKK